MKYSSRHYAEVLYDVLEKAKQEERKDILKRFFVMLQKHKATKILPRILKDYEKIVLEKQGMRKVEIESASPLDETTKQSIEKTLGSKVLLVEKVRPELLAGLTLFVDDNYFIDASARTMINNLFI